MGLASIVNRGPWSPEEDCRLTDLKALHGVGWAAMAAEMPGRTNVQCSNRWRVIDPASKSGPWTHDETCRLTELHNTHRDSSEVISQHIPGRSALMCCELWLRKLDPDIQRHRFTPDEDRQFMGSSGD